MRIGKYLKFHFECMETGRMKITGLCKAFRNDEFFKLIDPDNGDNNSYWGFDGERNPDEMEIATEVECDNRRYKYTELRQTVVLFMAAMNNEL